MESQHLEKETKNESFFLYFFVDKIFLSSEKEVGKEQEDATNAEFCCCC